MKRRTSTLSAGVAAFSMSMMLALPVASASTTWVNTGTQAFNLTNATPLGPLPASIPLRITVALGLRNKNGLDNYIASINTPGNALYDQSLTPAQFTADYGPTAEQVQAV